MNDRSTPRALELVAAYLGATPDELAQEWGSGAALATVAERYGRPRVGLEELVATIGAAEPSV
jgi:hypothetical protein